MLQRIKQARPGVTSAQRVGHESWFSLGAGRAAIWYSLAFTADGRFRVELSLGTSDTALNKALFDILQADRAEIETAIGESLSWERLENAKSARIAAYRDGRITDPPEKLEELKKFAVERFLAFRDAFTPRLQQAPLPATVAAPDAPQDASLEFYGDETAM